jgi:hypothetical protein
LVLGLELRAYTLSHSTSPFLWWVFFKIRFHELFAWTGFKPWSSYLCLLSSWDYRCELPVPRSKNIFRRVWSEVIIKKWVASEVTGRWELLHLKQMGRGGYLEDSRSKVAEFIPGGLYFLCEITLRSPSVRVQEVG